MASNLDISTQITRGTRLQVRRTLSRNRACLIQYSGDTLGRRYLLDAPEINVGRSSVNGIVIQDDSVSRQHARIISRNSAVALEDLGSSNGSFINEEPVLARTTLKDGDILRLGNILLKFFAHDNVENVFHDNIYRLATIDAGTELFNRKYLLETLEAEFRFCRVYKRPLSVIYYDLDYFKKVNDAHGHSCGDFILRECAQLAKGCVRTEDILARYGGEEFVAVLPNTDVRTAAELAERIRKTIAEYEFVFEGTRVKQTVSLGVAESNEQFKSATELLNDADRRLYLAKNSGRNQVSA